MHPALRLTALLAALALPATASAFDIWVPLGGPAADLEIDLNGTTLTVTSLTAAPLAHNAGANCAGTTVVLVCNFVGPFTVVGSHSDDDFLIKMNGSNAFVLDVVGRQGADRFDVVQADGGMLRMTGDADEDTYDVGASGSPLFIDPAAWIKVLPGAALGTRDLINFYADVEGYLGAVGTPQGDLVTVEGTVLRTASVGGLLDLDTAAGGDTVNVAVSQVETTYPISSAVERATFVLKTGAGNDTVLMSGSVDTIGGIYEIHGQAGIDELDMGGGGTALFTADWDGTWISDVLFLGGPDPDFRFNTIGSLVLNGSSYTVVWP